MKYSIVVCCYNGEKTIKACIASLVTLDYDPPDYEIVFINDGAIDRTGLIIQEEIGALDLVYPSMKYIETTNNGLSAARNYGINNSSGEIILFIDEDAVASKSWLLECDKSLKRDGTPAIYFGPVEPFEDANDFEEFIRAAHYTRYNRDGTVKPVMIGTNMGFHRDVFTEGSHFDATFTYRGDETALLILLNGNYESVYNEKMIVHHPYPKSVSIWLNERYHNGIVENKLRALRSYNRSRSHRVGMIVALVLIVFHLYADWSLVKVVDSILVIFTVTLIFSRKINILKYKFKSLEKIYSSKAWLFFPLSYVLKIIGHIYQLRGQIQASAR